MKIIALKITSLSLLCIIILFSCTKSSPASTQPLSTQSLLHNGWVYTDYIYNNINNGVLTKDSIYFNANGMEYETLASPSYMLKPILDTATFRLLSDNQTLVINHIYWGTINTNADTIKIISIDSKWLLMNWLFHTSNSPIDSFKRAN